MAKITTEEAHKAWITAEEIKRLTDRLIDLGPFSVGLEGLLAFVPVAGTVFSLAAGVLLLCEARRVDASRWTMSRMAFYVGLRTLASVVPLEGWLVDFFFRGHLMAATALQKDIARRYGVPLAGLRAGELRLHPANAEAV